VLEDFLAYLRLAVVEGREAVHELDLRVAGQLHRPAVDLVGQQQLDALVPDTLRLAHRDPDIRGEVVDPLDRRRDVLGELEARARCRSQRAGRLDQRRLRPEGLRCADAHVHAQQTPCNHQRVAHVEACIAHVAVADLLQRLRAVLHHRKNVGQRLGGVELVGQAVPDRHARVLP